MNLGKMQPFTTKLMFLFPAVLSIAVLSVWEASASTLEAVVDADRISCGVSQGLPGFANPDDEGNWRGIDVDLCRAVAAAVLGDATKVNFVPLSTKERFTALQSGEVNILTGSTTWSLSRDAGLNLHFVGINYYDGQGFMVRKSDGVKSAGDLDGAAVCTSQGTTSALNLADFFRKNGMTLELLTFERMDEALGAYLAGRCDAFSTDRSGLYARLDQTGNPEDHIILPETISKEPLAISVRQGDAAWADIVRWTLNAMIAAEELGVTSQNIDAMKLSTNPEILRFLGVTGSLGRSLGLKEDWAAEIIGQIGNYGESFDRNMGAGSPLNIDRGLNRQWLEGGLLYSPPFR